MFVVEGAGVFGLGDVVVARGVAEVLAQPVKRRVPLVHWQGRDGVVVVVEPALDAVAGGEGEDGAAPGGGRYDAGHLGHQPGDLSGQGARLAVGGVVVVVEEHDVADLGPAGELGHERLTFGRAAAPVVPVPG